MFIGTRAGARMITFMSTSPFNSVVIAKPEDNPSDLAPSSEPLIWSMLYSRLGVLANDYAGALLRDCGDEEALYRGARTVRAFVSAADLVRRMRRAEDEAEAAATAAQSSKDTTFTDAELRSIYDTIAAQVDLISEDDTICEDNHGAIERAGREDQESCSRSSDESDRSGGGVE